ncbi:hypothetical protein B0I35DRAFT_472915 [Stachybotrys elegans]|uniref:Ysc84 actin-binding domain-containing protein n=1 Tax=Stachybotrys elegans TaxID=80388 RepID=A0A8K0WX65_9HYPO|nr:hypothetical protein B0I35DRAFT_472915 [Stachybotrys elegans]
MHRVSSFLPSWEKGNSGARGSGGLFSWSNRSSASGPLTKIDVAAANAGRVHRESLWPATLDLECDKAARILKTFCDDGFLASVQDLAPSATPSEPRSPVKAVRKIPKRIIQNAAGIAVFTCMRSGLWMTGSGGSGILIARKSDGTWSPPSGIMLHTPTLSFVIGVDVYDCVLIVSNLAALEAITKPQVVLGEDIELTPGPAVALDSNEADINWRDIGKTVFTYMKSRGQLQTVNLNGCILTERANENERFYDSNLSQLEILAGNVPKLVEETTPLFEVIKMAEGRTDFDSAVISKIASNPAPGDAVIASPKSSIPQTPKTAFGIPNVDDPDPFGVLALEMAGLEIREAGTRLRPSSSQFDFNPSPISPGYSKFSRQSMDTFATRSNRGSYMSSRTTRSQVTDAGTQTRNDGSITPLTTPSPGQSEDGIGRTSFEQIPEVKEEEIDYTKIDSSALKHLSPQPAEDTPAAPPAEAAKSRSSIQSIGSSQSTPIAEITKAPLASLEESKTEGEEEAHDADADDEDDEDDEDSGDEEPVVIYEVASAQPAKTRAVASRMIPVKGNMVTIGKRIPPPLPLRSPARVSRSSKSDMGGEVSHLRSPLQHSFSDCDLKQDDNSDRHSTFSLRSLDRPRSPLQEVTRSIVGVAKAAEPNEVPSDATQEAPKLRVQTVMAEEVKTPVSTDESISSQESASDKSRNDSASLSTDSTYSQEQAENSDSPTNNQYTSSLCTRTTGERWSFDGSSLTTPTSDRPYSIIDEVNGEETPRKDGKDATAACAHVGGSQVAKLKATFECSMTAV